MKKMNNKACAAVCALLTLTNIGCKAYVEEKSGSAPAEKMIVCPVKDWDRAPVVPDYVVFAGDTIRLERADFRERMDRELLNFTYGHVNTTLILKRAPAIFATVEPLLKKYGVPDDLKYLMTIESNLNPSAYSVAGAAGLWQFMKGTAEEYGLEVNAFVDERYNIEKETAAACSYLKKAYARYKDWLTAAASYNAGMGAISGKLETQGEKSAMELWLVDETSRYMFRILAAKMLLENPAAFGYDVPADQTYPPLVVKNILTINYPVADLAALAKSNGVSYLQLHNANPWIRGLKLPNQNHKTYRIIIPSY